MRTVSLPFLVVFYALAVAACVGMVSVVSATPRSALSPIPVASQGGTGVPQALSVSVAGPSERPIQPRRDTPSGGTPLIITGQATWYGTGPGAGHAAAGSELRTGNWRGRHVEVCHGARCVRVVLDDWCACGGARIIDLSDEDFARLAPLSEGVISVTVRIGAGGPVSAPPVPTAPPTDVE